MSLRAKLITLILIFVVPTFGLTVTFYSHLVEEYRTQTADYRSSSINMFAGMLKLLEFDARTSLESASSGKEVLLQKPECINYLNDVITKELVFDHLFITNAKGDVTCSDDGFKEDDFSQSFFEEISKTDSFIFNKAVTQTKGNNSVLIAAFPIHINDNEKSGVITGTLSSSKISNVFSRVQLPRKTDIFLVDTDGNIFYSPSIKDKETLTLLKEELKKLSLSGQLTKQKIIINFTTMQQEFWAIPQSANPKIVLLINFQDELFINQAQQFTSGNIALISLITLVFLILAYTGVEFTFSKPMAQLTRTAGLLEKGQLHSRTNLGHKNDEIGELASLLDRMAASLEESRATLEDETSAKLASQEKFYRLFEDSLLGIFQVSPEGYLVESNPAMAKIFGYPSSEDILNQFTNKAGSLFVNDVDNQLIAQKIRERQSVHMETRFRKRDGSLFYGAINLWGVWNAVGDLESMEGFLEDISEKKATQSQLIKLSQAVEQNPIGIMITNGTGSIEYANHGCFEIFGYEPEELIGNTIRMLVPDSAQPEEMELISHTLRNGMPYRGEIQNFKKNGEPFWERFVASRIQNNPDDSPNTLLLLEDITEQYTNRARITQQVEELSALRTIDLAISSNLDLQATLNIIGNLAIKHLHIDAVSIELYDARFSMLHTAVHSGFKNKLAEDFPFPVAADLTDWELVEEFSVHIPEKLNERHAGSRLSFPPGDEFNSCFGLPLVAKAEVKGLFRVYLKEPLIPEQHWLDFFYNLAAQTAIALDNFEMLRNLKQSNTDLLEAYEATIEGWSKALKYRDAETEDHSVRTTRWTVELAQQMGYSEEDLVFIRRGALLHDIGKVAVPDNILNKPGPLTDQEWVQMRQHPVAAYEVLSPIKFLKKSLDIPYCHHERWDGTGYPRGLSREEIPLPARMFSVIDVYDALTTDRPYRKAWTQEKTIAYLRENSGSQFDPTVVAEFLSLLEKQIDYQGTE
jgi:PAS domain S-box-containing protein/putative nucleotidyltransferase with HDIG domain